jgi:hypothetical protein
LHVLGFEEKVEHLSRVTKNEWVIGQQLLSPHHFVLVVDVHLDLTLALVGASFNTVLVDLLRNIYTQEH